MAKRAERVPIGELVDLAALARDGRPVTPRRIREALPRGWALDDDNEHAHRDVRLLFREGWILILGLLVFGALGGVFLSSGVPSGWAGVLRVLGLIALVLVFGGVAAPLITRALYRR